LGGCPPGEARITKGYNLPANYIIHTVGPIWNGGGSGEIDTLKKSYYNSLKLAEARDLVTIAFPNISTGVYGFPKRKAAEIAIGTVYDFFKINGGFKKVIFVCFDEENLNIYKEILEPPAFGQSH
jgi:O-acetyl-ADP-ribose deacetylase (regulator of RNase III)